MYIEGFGRGWRPAGHRAKWYANKHGWIETRRNSCGDPIMYACGHIFEYLSYTYNAGHTHESCIVKRRIRGKGWNPSIPTPHKKMGGIIGLIKELFVG